MVGLPHNIPAVIVEVRDTAGNPMKSSSLSVTASFKDGAGQATTVTTYSSRISFHSMAGFSDAGDCTLIITEATGSAAPLVSNTFALTGQAKPEITEVVPTQPGPTEKQFRISGLNLLAASSCVIRLVSTNEIAATGTVDASLSSSTFIVCALLSGAEQIAADTEVALVVQAGLLTTEPFVSTKLFYHTGLAITSVFPVAGRSSGSTRVTVTGAGFLSVTDTAAAVPTTPMCRFGDTGNAVIANVISTSVLECTTVAQIPESVSVQVSFNNIDFYSDDNIKFEFQQCQPGTINDRFDLPCQGCPPSTFQPLAGQRLCNPCGKTEFQAASNATSCSLCPAYTHIPIEQDRHQLEACVCEVDFFLTNPATNLAETGKECNPCPVGGNCSGGTSQPVALEGHWNSKDAQHIIFKCAHKESCPGGVETCKAGSFGALCANCLPAHYKNDGVCAVCDEPDNITLLVIVGILAFGIVVVGLLSAYKKSKKVVPRAALDPLFIGLSFWQTTALYEAVRFNWGDETRMLFQFASFTNLNIEVIRSECYVPLDFETKLILVLAGPIVMWFLGTLIICLQSRKKDNPRIIAKSVSMAIVLNNVCFVGVASKILDVFDCQTHPSGVATLESQGDITCWEGRHASFMVPIATMFATFYTAFPLSVTTLLWRYHKSRWKEQDKSILFEACEPFFKKYSHSAYYWEVTVLIRKGLLVYAVKILTVWPFRSMTLILSILIISMIMTYIVDPYSDHENSRLEVIVLICSVGVGVLGIFFHAPPPSTENVQISQSLQDMSTWLSVGLLVFATVAIFLTVWSTMRLAWVEHGVKRINRGCQSRLTRDYSATAKAHARRMSTAQLGSGKDLLKTIFHESVVESLYHRMEESEGDFEDLNVDGDSRKMTTEDVRDHEIMSWLRGIVTTFAQGHGDGYFLNAEDTKTLLAELLYSMILFHHRLHFAKFEDPLHFLQNIHVPLFIGVPSPLTVRLLSFENELWNSLPFRNADGVSMVDDE
jgi:hypothetical protein